MKRFFGFILSLGFCIFAFSGCAFFRSSKSVSNVPYSGARARIAVADFEIKVANADPEIGLGLKNMFIASLEASKRFSVKDKEPSVIISAAVTEFEPQASGGRSGVGGGGGVKSGSFGGLLGISANNAHITLEIRIVEALNSAVLSTTKVQGQASGISEKSSGSVIQDTGPLGKELAGYANTPMEKAIRSSIIEATRYLAQAVPKEYYKYK